MELYSGQDAGVNVLSSGFKYTSAQDAGLSASAILALLLTVDGTGSLLDADLLDGVEGAEFLQRDGSVALTAAWDAGSFGITAETFTSDVATGTAPFTVSSTTAVTNLNADLVDGIEGANFLRSDVADTAAGVITFAASPTSPGAGATSERWGASSTAAGSNTVAFGNSADAPIDDWTVIGSAAGNPTATGAACTFVGYLAGNAVTTGYQLTGIGAAALSRCTTGYMNTAVGQRALEDCVDGYENMALGRQALKELTSGFRNVAVGSSALQALTIGNGNVGIGSSALSSCADGFNNMAIGYLSLYTLGSGDNNVAIGAEAMRYSTSAQYNVALGSMALNTNVTGSKNTAVGVNALRDYLGDDNLALGYEAMRFATTGAQNVGIGTTALRTCTTGYQNVGIGSLALYTLLDGHTNTAIGYNAMRYTTSGYNNVGIGFQALLDNTTGYRNTGIGRDALENVTAGYLNIGIGYDAGRTLLGGNSNTIIGASADTVAAAVGSIALGTWATCTASNQWVVGSDTVPVTQAYFGEGVTSATPQAFTINATGGTVNTVSGSDLVIAAGVTVTGGVGTGGNLLFKTAATDTLATQFSIDQTGLATFTVSPTSPGPAGTNNEVWGTGAGAALAAGDVGNTFLGDSAGATVDATNNVCVGYLADCASGVNSSVCVGKGATSQADGQIVFGLNSNSGTSSNVIMIGNTAGNASMTGSANVGAGAFVFNSCTSGTRNFGFGNTCLQNLTIGASNVCMGIAAGNTLVSGSRNVLLGDTADTGAAVNDVVCIGHQAACTGQDNTVIGSQSSVASTKTDAVVIGAYAAAQGSGAIAIGNSADTGTANNGIFIGNFAGRAAGTGAANVALGAFALDAFTSGNRNFALGNSSLTALTTGVSNVCVGVASGDAVVGGSRNILFGDAANCGASQNDTVGIGHGAAINADKAIGIGRGVVLTYNSIAMGYGAADTAAAQFVCGSATTPITDIYFGEGVTDATPPDAVTIHGTGGSGTDIAGADLILAGGISTGAGASGEVLIQVAPAGGTGTTPNALGTIGQFTETGLTVSGNILLSETLTLSGSSKLLDMNGNDIDNIGTAQVKVFMQDATPTANNADDLWYETDTNIWWFWNGTYWLSCDLFTMDAQGVNVSATGMIGIFTPEIDTSIQHDLFIVDWCAAIYQSSSGGSAGNYWNVKLDRTNAVGAATTISTLTSQNNSDAVYTIEKNTVDTHLDLTALVPYTFQVNITKVGTPNNSWIGATATYRLAHL